MANTVEEARRKESLGWRIFCGVGAVMLGTALFFLAPIIVAVILAGTAIASAVVSGVLVLAAITLVFNFKGVLHLLRAASREVTNKFVPIMPISVMEVSIAGDIKKGKMFRETYEEVATLMKMQERDVENLERQEADVLAQIRGLGDRAAKRTLESLGGQLEGVRDSLKQRRAQLRQITMLATSFGDLREVCDIKIREKRAWIEKYRSDDAAAKATSKAVKSARAVLGEGAGLDDNAGLTMSAMAAAAIDEQYARALVSGEMLVADFRGDIIKRDISRAVNVQRVVEERQEMAAPREKSEARVRVDVTLAPVPEDDEVDLLPVAKRASNRDDK